MLPGRWFGLAIACLVLAPETTASWQESPPGQGRVVIRGIVVDDETGEPIESFTLEHGRVKGQDVAGAVWGGQSRTVPNSYTIVDGKAIPTRHTPAGEFDESLEIEDVPGRGQAWCRILADGYEPQPITEKPPVAADADTKIDVTVRLKRGRPLVGRVVDHEGRPSAGAKLFLIRPTGMNIRIVDDVIGEGSDTGLVDPSVTRAVADEQGRFRITGVGDAKALGISATSVHYATVPIPQGDEPTIRLPEPATLRIPYAIEGDEAEADIQLIQVGEKGRVWVVRKVRVPNGGEVVLRDASPGPSTLWKRKLLVHDDYRQKVGVEHRKLTLAPGEVAVASYVRERGHPIQGKVSELELGEARMMFVAIEPVVPPEGKPPGLGIPLILDIVACDADGRFRTARIPPGEYAVRAVGYRHQPRYGPFSGFMEASDFSGSGTVVVPEDGKPPEVRLKLDARRLEIDPAR